MILCIVSWQYNILYSQQIGSSKVWTALKCFEWTTCKRSFIIAPNNFDYSHTCSEMVLVCWSRSMRLWHHCAKNTDSVSQTIFWTAATILRKWSGYKTIRSNQLESGRILKFGFEYHSTYSPKYSNIRGKLRQLLYGVCMSWYNTNIVVSESTDKTSLKCIRLFPAEPSHWKVRNVAFP